MDVYFDSVKHLDCTASSDQGLLETETQLAPHPELHHPQPSGLPRHAYFTVAGPDWAMCLPGSISTVVGATTAVSGDGAIVIVYWDSLWAVSIHTETSGLLIYTYPWEALRHPWEALQHPCSLERSLLDSDHPWDLRGECNGRPSWPLSHWKTHIKYTHQAEQGEVATDTSCLPANKKWEHPRDSSLRGFWQRISLTQMAWLFSLNMAHYEENYYWCNLLI